MEHRWGRRVVGDMPIHIAATKAALMKQAQLANLSISGARVDQHSLDTDALVFTAGVTA